MKIGLIRCMQTEEMCPATRCLDAMRRNKDAFAGVEGDLELVGVTTCGGCPGKKAGLRAAMMLRRGAEAIALASCITKGTPIDYACPLPPGSHRWCARQWAKMSPSLTTPIPR